MDAKDVAEYLKQHPKFFEDYADVLAEIFVPHPHGGHAIPIAERQILTLRERNAGNGSLNPMCPTAPMPSNCKSMPPTAAMRSS